MSRSFLLFDEWLLCRRSSYVTVDLDSTAGDHLQNSSFRLPIAHARKVTFDKFLKTTPQSHINLVEEVHRRPPPFSRELLNIRVLTLNYERKIVWRFSRTCTGENFCQGTASNGTSRESLLLSPLWDFVNIYLIVPSSLSYPKGQI